METTPIYKQKTFLTAVLAGIVTLVVFFVGKYFAAGLEDVQMILNVLVPITLAVIAAYAVDDAIKTHARAQVEIESIRAASALDGLKAQREIEQMRLTQWAGATGPAGVEVAQYRPITE